jgi:hypothetical protein
MSCRQQPAPPPRDAAKMSPRISTSPEPVLAAHVPSPPAAGSHCPARDGSAPHLGNRVFRTTLSVGVGGGRGSWDVVDASQRGRIRTTQSLSPMPAHPLTVTKASDSSIDMYNNCTPTTHPPIPPATHPTLKIPPSKAWRRLHRAKATSPRAAHRIANNPRTVQRIAAYCIATSSHASARASHPVHRSAPRECNQPARSASHRKQSAHRAARRPHR